MHLLIERKGEEEEELGGRRGLAAYFMDLVLGIWSSQRRQLMMIVPYSFVSPSSGYFP